MDPTNGLYTDLDSFGLSNCSNGFNDTCPTLPSLNNFKYQQTNLLSNNNYQQPVQTLHDQSHNNSTKSTSTSLPQTQININNCNNNIFFPHDDGIFDANTSSSCASSTTIPNNGGVNNQKNNFIGHVRKELGSTNVSGGDNINPLKNVYFNINNINTNIVNNIQNPPNFVTGADIFGGNQCHQINKNGETIINFTNNNLNSTGNSQPTDTVTATSQNYYGYQSNTNNGQGQQTVYEASVQSSQSSSTFLDPNLSASSKTTMGTSGMGHYSHGHHHSQGSMNQTMTNGSYIPGNANTISSEHSASSVDPFIEYQEPLSTAKIINNFETKNPLKYPTTQRSSGAYYKPPSEYAAHQYPSPVNHLSPHSYHPSLYSNANGIPTKISPTQHYESYSRIPRNTGSHYTPQHYSTPPNAHSIDEHNGSRMNYNLPPAVVPPPYPPHPHSLPHPQNNYGNYYTNGYNPYPSYSQMPGPPSPYVNSLIRNESCSKPSTNFNKTGAVALSPVEHSNYTLPLGAPNYGAPKKDFYPENPYYPPHPYYEDPMNGPPSCAKKTSSSRTKVPAEIYNPNGAPSLYQDHHTISHHPPNGNVMRNVAYQPMPKHYVSGNSYQMPTNSCDLAGPYQHFNYQYKNGEHPKMMKMNPALAPKQFKNYGGHYEPMPHPYAPPHPSQYHMQAKHSEKVKISLDLEEQINSSKIPKMREPMHPAYGYDPHHHHYYHQYHHHIPSRNAVNDNDPKNSIANINISLRDFLSTWNEIDDDDESGERRPATMSDMNEHMERTIMREYNPMFVQKATDSFMSASEVPSNINAEKSHFSELESGIINEGTEKLYVLESIDVPLSELNKYKHLSVINKLPENVVINDKELYADDNSMKFIEGIDLTREKLYKSEFELEFEACQERKINKPIDEPEAVKIEQVVEEKKIDNVVAVVATDGVKEEEEIEEVKKLEEVDLEKLAMLEKKRKVKEPKLKSEKAPKVKQNILKLKKEKNLKATSKDPRKVRITKRVKKYSLNLRASSVKSLKSICVDFVNTSAYRNYAREQYSIINKFSKMRILKDFKKKFNFDGMKKTPGVNQKFNHSRINSLSEICGKYLKDKSKLLEINDDDDDFGYSNEFPTLKELSRQALTEMDNNIYLYSPLSLKELCEDFVYSHRQYFVIEEVSSVPKLQDLCKSVLSETNIFINIDEDANAIFELNDEQEALQSDSIVDDEPIYIVEESSGNVGELFESENLNSFEKSEILRKIQQRVANIDDDDEIIRAIGALHRDDDVESIISNNNNSSNVSNKNIGCENENFSESNEFVVSNDEMKFDSEMSFISYMDDDMMHSVQYEEIICGNDKNNKSTNKIVEILRHKYLNRSDVRQSSKTIKAILKKSLAYQRAERFCNAKRREQIDVLKQQLRAALLKSKKESKSCEIIISNSDERTSSSSSAASPINQHEYENESHKMFAKDYAQPHQISISPEPITIIDDSPVDNFMDDTEAEHNNLPQLASVLPSINEYKIDRKSSNRSDVKDNCDAKKRRLNFEESLLGIDKIYGKSNDVVVEENQQQNHHHSSSGDRKSSSRNNDRHSSSSRHHSSRRHHEKSRSRHHSSRNGHHTSSRSHRSTRSRSHEREKSFHYSSRHNFYRNDQMKHSEAKRLVIPSYKLYDKDLDVKLKIMPFVRIEREEKVDEMVKHYN